MWPAVREAARRILRLDEVVMTGPARFSEDFHALALSMADAQPSRLTFPPYTITENEWIDILLPEATEELPMHVVRLGIEEAPEDTCWIPFPLEASVNAVLEACQELLSAGYPGCIGCGGPNSEMPWDEQTSRQKWVSSQDPKPSK
tara:strand:- start:990 stop:1427 length:438 start_codon:yes stop_codon:yes gene_type:complete